VTKQSLSSRGWTNDKNTVQMEAGVIKFILYKWKLEW